MQKQITVETTAVPVGAASDVQVLIQNLGPDPVYLGTDASVTSLTGIKMLAGGSFTSPKDVRDLGIDLFLVSDGSSDVRLMRVG